MSALKNKAIMLAVAAGILVPALPAYAAVYYVVFAGKPVPVDCPESPAGHDMNWVNLNCKQVARATAGGDTPTVVMSPFGKLKLK